MLSGFKLQLKVSEMGNYGLYVQLIIQQGNLSWLNSSQLDDVIVYF